MFVSRILVIAGTVLAATIAWLVAPAAVGRPAKWWEVLVVALVAWGLLQWQRQRQLRQQRMALESIRDSALW